MPLPSPSTALQSPASPTPRWWSHHLVLGMLAVAVVILFLREPGFGDDLTYWSLAFDLHDVGGSEWSVRSFHDLRWPVWGVSWLWQGIFGPGLASFYCTPALYLVAGSALAFIFGRLVMRSLSGAWACGLGLLFLPLLDPVISRPMPDLSESVFGATALLAWWSMMQSANPRRAALAGVLCGVSIGLAFSNRITGIFIVPVLVVATLLFHPRRWRWLCVPAAISALFFGIEGAIYHSICGDWLHSIHANLNGRGATDTQVMAAWELPVRYLSGFFRGNRLAPIYSVLAMIGLWAGWKKHGTEGRLAVVWFGVLYLEYSCAVQSIHPIRPLIGSTIRYLAGLSLPMSVLTGLGAIELAQLFARLEREPARRVREWCRSYPWAVGTGAVAALALLTSRPTFDPGFTPDLQRRMQSLRGGTTIFTHHAMRDLAFMVAPREARRFAWFVPKAIMQRSAALEAQAAACDEFWYLRKQLWMADRKRMEREGSGAQLPLGTYLDAPGAAWALADVLVKGSDPDLVFYRRRLPGTPAPRIFTVDSDEFHGLFSPLPWTWDHERHARKISIEWKVPPALRGKLLALEFEGTSGTVEPLIVKLQFMRGRERLSDLLLKPILHASGGKDFFALPIPADADICHGELRFAARTKSVEVTAFRAVLEEAR